MQATSVVTFCAAKKSSPPAVRSKCNFRRPPFPAAPTLLNGGWDVHQSVGCINPAAHPQLNTRKGTHPANEFQVTTARPDIADQAF